MKTGSSYREISRRAAEDPTQEVTYTQTLWTTIGAHGDADKLDLLAFRMGLTCNRRSTRGWFERQHVLRMHGTVAQIKKFLEATKGWLW